MGSMAARDGLVCVAIEIGSEGKSSTGAGGGAGRLPDTGESHVKSKSFTNRPSRLCAPS